MSQFGSMIPEDQFAPTQDIPFEGGYALSPDTSAMMQAGSQNMDQPIFPRLRPGMPALNPQDIETLMTAPARPAPPPQGVLTDEELNAIRARQGGYEPLPQLQQAEVRWDEGLRATAPGETASDVFFRQLRGEEDRTQAEVAEIPTLEEQFPKTSEEDLIASIRFSKQLEGITNYNYLGRNVTELNEGFDRVMANRFLQRDLRAGNLNSKFVADYVRNSKIGEELSTYNAFMQRLQLGQYQLASGVRAAGSFVWAVLANEGVMPYSIIDENWAPETLADAIAWAEYGRSLQENKFVPDSMAGRITLDLVELLPAYTFQLAAATAGTLVGGPIGGIGAYAVAGGGVAGSSQFNESLTTYIQAGVDPQRAAQLAMRDGAYSLASMTVSDAIFGRLALVGKIGKKTAKAVERAANATKMQVIGKGVSRGILGEGVPEGVESASVDFLVNLHREGMPEFEEFYKQNPDWVYDVLRNAGYETLLGSMIGAPVGIRTQFRAAADARQVNETMRTVFGALPQDHPVMRLFEKDALTVEDASKALTWLSKTREKIGKITAADIEAQRKVGAGLEYGNLSNEALQNIIIAGNDGSVTAPLRGAPEGGRFAGIEFAITPSMAADELARRGLSTGQAPGAATAVGVRAMPTDVDPKSVSTEDVGAWVSNNERMAAAMAAQAEPISRRQMEEVFGGPFQGNNSSLRARFKENLTRALNQRAGLRDPARLSASIENARRAAAQDAVEMLTGLDGIELQRVAIGLSPRQAKAVSETLAEAERETRRGGRVSPEDMFRSGQDDRAVAMQRQREEAGMAAAAGARGEIGRGEVARRAGEREAARRATEREQRMQEIVRSTTGMEAMREAQAAAVEALDRVEGVMRGTEEQQVVPMTDAMDAISVVEELARQAGIDAEQAMAPIRARATALAAVEEYARTQDLTPGMREAIGTTRRDRTAGRVADIIVEARRRAIDQYERDERTMAEDPNYIVSRLDAVRLISQEPEIADDIQTVIRSKSAFGLELAEARRKLDSQFILSLGQEPPAEGVVAGIEEEGEAPDAGAVRSAEMRLRDLLDRIRRTGTGERAPAPTPTMEETRAAVDAALVSEQEQAEKRMAELRMEQAELRRERRELADAAHTGKRGQRTKKRKPMTEREKEVAQRLEEIDGELEELSDQVNDIANRRGMTAEAALEPKDVKETDSFPGVTASKRLEQIMDGRRQIAEANGIGTDELQIRYDDGQMRLTPAEKRLSNFGRKLGVTVVFAKGPRGLSTRGAYISGVVFIRQSDVSSPQAYFSVALHEAVHHLAKTDREYFTNLYNMLRRKAPKALREMSAVYRKKLEFQKNQAAPRNAALQIMGDTGPDADARRDALIWLIRNDKGADYATVRENPGQTLAEVIDSYGPRAARPQQQALNEVRGLFAELVKRARQVNLSVRDVQEEEVANLAEMLFDTTFFAAVNDEGKIDITRIREIADTPRALSLFGRIAEMIDDVADALGVVKKDRALNPAQVARLREFMRTPEELAEPKVRIALQQLIAKSLTHMMDVRRGRVETEVAPPKPMSDARAADEIPGLMQSIDPQSISWTNSAGHTITQNAWFGSPQTFTSIDGRNDDVAIGFLSPHEAFGLARRLDVHFGTKRTDAFLEYVRFMVDSASKYPEFAVAQMWMRPKSSPYRRAWASGSAGVALFHPDHFDMEVFAHELKHVLTMKTLRSWVNSAFAGVDKAGEGYMKGVSQLALSPAGTINGQTLSDLARLFLHVNGLSEDLKGFAASNIEWRRYGESAAIDFDFSRWSGVQIHGKMMSPSIAYGLTNLDEFVAQAAADLEFQNFLRSIELPNTGPFRTFASAWDKIVDIIARLIPGLEQKYPSNNALQRVLALTNEMLDMTGVRVPIRVEQGMQPWAVEVIQKAEERKQQAVGRTGLAQQEAERILQRANVPGQVFFPQSLEMPERIWELQREKVVGTPKHKAWFRESKVVEPSGRHMVVYHGTNNDFTVFGYDEEGIPVPRLGSIVGFFSESRGFAAQYGRKIVPVFLRIEKPFDFRDKQDASRVIDEFIATGAIAPPSNVTKQFKSLALEGRWEVLEDERFLAFIRSKGYDGIVLQEKGVINYGIFNPNQAKSIFNESPTMLPGIHQSLDVDPDDLEPVRFLGGSTGAQLMQDQKGNRYVVKRGANPDQAKSEASAADIYAAVGVPVPRHMLDDSDQSTPRYIMEYVEGRMIGDLSGRDFAEAARKMRRHFAVDALLANWDVIGSAGDNVIVVDGEPLRVDNGGAMQFRAQGGQKSFGPTVVELESMRTSDQGQRIFGPLTNDEVAAQIADISRNRATILSVTPADLREIMSERIDFMERWAFDKAAPRIMQALEMPKTAEAQRFYEESQIRDETGALMPMFHGTPRATFDEFDVDKPGNYGIGAYFTNRPRFTANQYAMQRREEFGFDVDPEQRQSMAGIYPVFLNIKNPFDFNATADAEKWRNNKIVRRLGLNESFEGMNNFGAYRLVVDRMIRAADARTPDAVVAVEKELRSSLMDMGYDGATVNIGDGEIYAIAWKKNQIKSVFNLRPTELPGISQSIQMPSAVELGEQRGDMVSRIDGSYRNSNTNVEPGDIDDAERTIDQSISDEDSRFGRLSRAVNDTARRLTGREVPTREDRDAIEVVKRPADISPFWKFVAAPLNIAIASKNAEVISVVEDIIDFDIKRNMLTERRNREARTRWESIPQAERNEAEFAKYMDEFHDPATIDSDPEFAGKSQAWRDALKWFKERDEARRNDIIAVKREGIRRALQRDKASRIVEKAAQNGLEWEVVRGGRNRVRISTAEGNVTVDQARDMLAMRMMPDTWGRQYAHFFHWFAGEWKLTAYDADGNRTIIGSAKTEAEAFERLYRHRRDNPGQYRRYQAEPNVFVNPDDVVRLSTGQRRRLESLLSQATGASRTDVDDSLRGIVGSKGAKRPFYAPLMERTGAQGFETEFMKVWELSERLHNRWVMGGEMVRTITPRIEKIRQTMPGWAKYLDETMDHTLFTKPTAVEQAVDRFVRSIPVVGRLTSPFFTRRWLGAARALNYGRQLLTVRQQVVNSFQPLQTLYPILGESNFAKAVSFYNSPEAKEVLERHGRMSADGKFREGSEETIPGVDIGGFLTRMNESVYKQTNGGVNLSSEARNQNFAFIAMYWHATNNLGMGDAEAARYARIYGNVYTQFYYTKANLPWIVRGPVAATALQYRRFMINMTGLMVNEFQKGNYSGVGRYLGTQFLLGGAQAVIGFSAFGLIRSLYLGDKEGADDLSFKMREWLKDSLGSDKAADIAMMGLPAAVGIDLSGSISVWQKPFGRTLYEKAGATFAGPTVNTLLQAYTNLTGDTVVPMNPLERGYRAFAETSPTIQQMVAAWKAFNGDNAEYDARGRLKYTLDPEDAWIKAGAFRTVDESIWRMEYERLRIIRNEVDRYSDRAATQLAVGNTAEARRILGEFNGMYPMAAMTLKDIKRRAEGKRQARTIPQAERRVEVDVGTRVREIAQAEGIGE